MFLPPYTEWTSNHIENYFYDCVQFVSVKIEKMLRKSQASFQVTE